jgi:hypothetical protein
MPVTSEWYDFDARLVIVRFENPWTWTELIINLEQGHSHIYAMKDKVGVIFHLPEPMILPPNILSQTRSLAYKTPGNVVCSAIVTQSRVIDSLISIFNKLHVGTNKSLYVTRSVEEAVHVISEHLAQQR